MSQARSQMRGFFQTAYFERALTSYISLSVERSNYLTCIMFAWFLQRITVSNYFDRQALSPSLKFFKCIRTLLFQKTSPIDYNLVYFLHSPRNKIDPERKRMP